MLDLDLNLNESDETPSENQFPELQLEYSAATSNSSVINASNAGDQEYMYPCEYNFDILKQNNLQDDKNVRFVTKQLFPDGCSEEREFNSRQQYYHRYNLQIKKTRRGPRSRSSQYREYGLVNILKTTMGTLAGEKHAKYILLVEKKKDDVESVLMEHLRINGAYWGLTTLDILGKLEAVEQEQVVSWIISCQHESGGFGGNEGHDPHVLYTLSAIQILALFDKIDVLDIEKVSSYVASLQNEDGSFSGDIWGEIDTRFSYVAICSLALLQRLDKINVEKAVKYIISCKNLDGGFGCTPGAESHAGQIFCCIGALAITGSLHYVDKDLLGWWLCERQVKSGGLNGRPEKLPDVCYSWWVLSSLIMIDRVHWIDKDKLVKFILDCQDMENGGISDRPDDAVDVFHTYFGVAGLSLLEYPGVKAIDPAYALPVDVVNRIFLR
ncbi:hypothetical protein OSB04_009480 [Centaurea solstitialis]|uniref:Geranylgeranyl transferase type-2 subunit beta n=2 Tax=Centaurea solstitialis TaxID=347529 RepID=A0AA38TIX8_9ASTR|nr:hypothetical protein OSB04_009480 [Centaurea solstitialis]